MAAHEPLETEVEVPLYRRERGEIYVLRNLETGEEREDFVTQKEIDEEEKESEPFNGHYRCQCHECIDHERHKARFAYYDALEKAKETGGRPPNWGDYHPNWSKFKLKGAK